jgi:hypothetical protein
MENQKLVLVETLCVHYEIETSFFESLEEIGLIILVRQRDEIYVSEEKVAYLEKVLRLQKELNVNLEGIDVIFNLLEKVESLQSELSVAMQRLNYVNERI